MYTQNLKDYYETLEKKNENDIKQRQLDLTN
jgi:hypothetical protein